MRFSGKTALVTGASVGIGRAIALAIGAEGGRVGLVARSREPLEEARDVIDTRRGPSDALELGNELRDLNITGDAEEGPVGWRGLDDSLVGPCVVGALDHVSPGGEVTRSVVVGRRLPVDGILFRDLRHDDEGRRRLLARRHQTVPVPGPVRGLRDRSAIISRYTGTRFP